MKTITIKNKLKKIKFLSLLGLMIVLISIISCSSDGNDSGTPIIPVTYPREAIITYKMTGTGVSIPVTSGSYVNNTGGSTTFDQAPLPYTRTFTRTVNKLDDIGISFIHNNSGNGNTPFSIKLEILVDNVVVKTETYNGQSSLIGSIVYLFP